MDFGPKQTSLVAAAVLLLATTATLGQEWPPHYSATSPAEVANGPAYGFGCADCGSLGCTGLDCGPNQGWFFQYDRVYWSLSAPDVTTIGDPNEEGLVAPPGLAPFFHRNDLNTSFLEAEFKTGNRFDFGRVVGQHGWGISVVHIEQSQSLFAQGVNFIPADPDSLLFGFIDGNNDTFDDDLNANNIFGRSGEDLGTPAGGGGFAAPFDGTPDVPAPTDLGDGVFWRVVFTDVTVRNMAELTGFEWMGIYRSPESGPHGVLEWSYGVRYQKFKDRFDVYGSGGFLDAMRINTIADNDIVGPQFGVRWTTQSGYFRLALEGRFLAGFNFQRTEQFGEVASNQTFGGTNEPINLTGNSFNHALTNEAFAPQGELRGDLVYKINRCVAFRTGYTFVVTGGMSRASERVVYTLPNFGINPNASEDEVLISNALTFGLEFNR